MNLKNRILELKPELEYNSLKNSIARTFNKLIVDDYIKEIKELVEEEFSYAIDYSYGIKYIQDHYIVLENIFVVSDGFLKGYIHINFLRIRREK